MASTPPGYEDDQFEDDNDDNRHEATSRPPPPHAARGNGHEQQEEGDEAEAMAAVRSSIEYKVAWDVELWKATQLAKVDREVALKRKRLLEDGRKEAEAKVAHMTAVAEREEKDIATRQRKLAEEEKALERRKLRLLEAEKTIKQRLNDIDDLRKRAEGDADVRVQRVTDEYSHKKQLLEERLSVANEEAKRHDERLTASQRDYMKLWEDFAEFKTNALTKSPYHDEIASLRTRHSSEILAVSERHERQQQELVRDFTQRLSVATEESRRLSSITAARKEQLKQAQGDLGQARTQRDDKVKEVERLVGENAILQRRLEDANGKIRELLRSSSPNQQQGSNSKPTSPNTGGDPTTSDLRNFRDLVTAGAKAASRGPPTGPKQQPTAAGGSSTANHSNAPAAVVRLRANLRRWQQERLELLGGHGGGAYTPASPIIVQLDMKMREAREALANIAAKGVSRGDGGDQQ